MMLGWYMVGWQAGCREVHRIWLLQTAFSLRVTVTGELQLMPQNQRLGLKHATEGCYWGDRWCSRGLRLNSMRDVRNGRWSDSRSRHIREGAGQRKLATTYLQPGRSGRRRSGRRPWVSEGQTR